MKFKNSLLFITSLIWGFNFVFQHLAMESIGPFLYSALRYTIATITMALICLAFNKRFIFDKKTVKAGLTCGGILFSASVLQQIGLIYVAPAKAGFITTLYVIFVPLISFMFYKEKPTKRLWLAACCSLIGLYLLTAKSSSGFEFSDMLLILSAIIYAVHIILIDHFADEDVNIFEFNLIQFIMVVIFSSIFVFIVKEPIQMTGFKESLPMFLYSGALSTSVAFTTQTFGQKDNDPTIASLIMSLESVFATLGGYLILKNVLSINEIIGSIIIFASIIYVQLPSKKKG